MRLIPNIDDSRVTRSLPDVQSMDMVKGTRSDAMVKVMICDDQQRTYCDVYVDGDGIPTWSDFAVAATSTEKRGARLKNVYLQYCELKGVAD
jgi:hypothetical protein